MMDIARQTGFDRRTVAKWIRAEASSTERFGPEYDVSVAHRGLSIAPLVRRLRAMSSPVQGN